MSDCDKLPMESTSQVTGKKVPIWNYFVKSNSQSSKCLTCGKTLKSDYGSTTGIRKHLERVHHSKYVKFCEEERNFKKLKNERKSTFVNASETVPSAAKVSKLDSFCKSTEKYGTKHPKNIAVKKAVTKWIAEGLHPFTIINEPGFKNLIEIADEKLVLPTATTISRNLMPDLYDETKLKLKQFISNQHLESISITTDMWSSESIDSFLGITAHFVDDKMNLKSICLACVPVPESHTGENIAVHLNSTLSEWGLNTVKYIYCVTDNAANMQTAVAFTTLEQILCFAHTLSLALRDVKKYYVGFETLIKKCRSIVSHFRHSPTAKADLQKRQEQLGQQKLELIQDVETRWNSEYSMMERLMTLKEPLCLELSKPGCNVDNLTSTDWGMVEAYVSILKPFFDATCEVSSEKKPTMSMVIPLVHGLKSGLQSIIDNKKDGITLSKHLLQALQSRFPMIEQRQPNQISMLLDPRFKDSILAEPSWA